MKANGDKVNEAHAGVGSVSHTTCMLLQLAHRRQADRGRLSRHRPGAERPRRRAGRLTCATRSSTWSPQIQGGNIKAYRDRDARALAGAARRADHQGGRPAGISRSAPGTRCSRPRARRRRSSPKLNDALDKALDDEGTASACSTSAACSRKARPHAGRRCRSSSRARSRAGRPVLKAAGATARIRPSCERARGGPPMRRLSSGLDQKAWRRRDYTLPRVQP